MNDALSIHRSREAARAHRELMKEIDEAAESVPCASTWADAFFPENEGYAGTEPTSASWALMMCRECPVIEACARYAIDYEEHGIWGGLRASERKALRSRKASALQSAR